MDAINTIRTISVPLLLLPLRRLDGITAAAMPRTFFSRLLEILL